MINAILEAQAYCGMFAGCCRACEHETRSFGTGSLQSHYFRTFHTIIYPETPARNIFTTAGPPLRLCCRQGQANAHQGPDISVIQHTLGRFNTINS